VYDKVSVSNKFLKPSDNGKYLASQADIIFGLWTPYGLISPLMTGIDPDGSILIVYALRPGADFKNAQKKKIDYIKARGVRVDVMPLEMNYGEADD
jgi:hypothetical protein